MPTLFGTDDPDAIVERASAHATALMRVVKEKKLAVRIQGKDHPLVECWTLLGSMLGVFPVVEWTRPVYDADGNPIGWEARVEAKTRAGEVVGAAEAECLRSEKRWSKADDYAVRSMAQTRAISKALRMPLGFIVQLAGLSPTPAEEMDGVEQREREFVGYKASVEQIKELRAVLDVCATHDPIWEDRQVLASASRRFRRTISQLTDLTEEEAKTIMAGAEMWAHSRGFMGPSE